jgi:hypothetical protein
VDRIRALGNAVVPEIPYRIGRAILAYEQQLAMAAYHGFSMPRKAAPRSACSVEREYMVPMGRGLATDSRPSPDNRIGWGKLEGKGHLFQPEGGARHGGRDHQLHTLIDAFDGVMPGREGPATTGSSPARRATGSAIGTCAAPPWALALRSFIRPGGPSSLLKKVILGGWSLKIPEENVWSPPPRSVVQQAASPSCGSGGSRPG